MAYTTGIWSPVIVLPEGYSDEALRLILLHELVHIKKGDVFFQFLSLIYEKRHFAFTSISDMMKDERKKTVLSIIIAVIMLFFAVLMAYYGFKVTKQFWNYTWVNIPSFKRGPTWLCLPLCGITSAIYLVNQIVEDVAKLAKGGNK